MSEISISYTEASNMMEDEIMEANAALDLYIEQQKNNAPKPRKKGVRK